MTVLIIETDREDVWPCPEGCGRMTEDPYGGPCQRCWDAVPGPWDETQTGGEQDG